MYHDISQFGRAGRKAHDGRPAKATGRLVRRAQQDPAASLRGCIEQRVDHDRGAQSRPRAEPDLVRKPLDPTMPDHRPTHPAIAGSVVQHRPAQ